MMLARKVKLAKSPPPPRMKKSVSLRSVFALRKRLRRPAGKWGNEVTWYFWAVCVGLALRTVISAFGLISRIWRRMPARMSSSPRLLAP